jgi:hypothetical protein
MKICWDIIEKVRYNPKLGAFRYNNSTYYEYDTCRVCGDSYLGQKVDVCCSKKCAQTGKIRTEETKTKMSLWQIGKIVSDESKQKNRESHLEKRHTKEAKVKIVAALTGRNLTEETKTKIGAANSKGENGTTVRNVPVYETYAPQLELYEESRCNADDPSLLEVRCTYCGKWYMPTTREVRSRIIGINKNDLHRFYCSDNCKSVCPIFGKSAQQLIKRDKIASGQISPEELVREIQPELRQMSFARDEYLCVKCGSPGPLHCHHIDPVASNPIESADLDNCITLCVDCHKEAHQISGCGYVELRKCV